MNSHNPSGFLDIHSHLLPGLDDGPEDYGQCLEIARRYRTIGVEAVIATPHGIQGTGWAPEPMLVRTRVAEAEKWLNEAGVGLCILPGMEIALSDFLCGHFAPSSLLSLGDTGVFLIEFPLNSAISAPTAEGMRSLQNQNRANRFIIAHPERCVLFQDNPGRILELVAGGIMTQVNMSSILGYSGKKAQRTALALLDGGQIHFLATDTHGRAGRMPPDLQELAQLTKLIGSVNVATGFRDNPRRLIAGEDVLPLQARTEDAGKGSSPKNLMHSLLNLLREH
jgi:protein-tyrosine phosphatase